MGPLISDSRAPRDRWPWERRPGDSGDDQLWRMIGALAVIAFFGWVVFG